MKNCFDWWFKNYLTTANSEEGFQTDAWWVSLLANKIDAILKLANPRPTSKHCFEYICDTLNLIMQHFASLEILENNQGVFSRAQFWPRILTQNFDLKIFEALH